MERCRKSSAEAARGFAVGERSQLGYHAPATLPAVADEVI